MKRKQLVQLIVLLIFLVKSPVCFAEDIAKESTFKILVDGKMLSAPQVLSLYIQHRSVSSEEKQAGEWLKNVCQENKLIIEQFGNENGNYNFAASLYPLSDSLPNIIFLNHIDVVEAGDPVHWIHPPYSGYITDTEIWGRGAFDNKGAAIMQLFSILEFMANDSETTHQYNITFLAVSCEETQCAGGISYVIDNFLEDLKPVTVIGEGATELSELIKSEKENYTFGISTAHKRPYWLELKLNIHTSGHGSVTPLEYANKEMTIALSGLLQKRSPAIFNPKNMQMLRMLGEQKSGLEKFILKHPGIFRPIIVPQLRKQPEIFSLFSNTITLTSLNSNNSTINHIPHEVTALLDCRLMPEYPKEQFYSSIRKALDNDSIRIKVLTEMRSVASSDSYSDIYKNLEASIMEVYPGSSVFPITLPNFNDVGIFRLNGINGYSVIPVILEAEYLKCIHGDNERIPIKALHQGSEVYLRFIETCMN